MSDRKGPDELRGILNGGYLLTSKEHYKHVAIIGLLTNEYLRWPPCKATNQCPYEARANLYNLIQDTYPLLDFFKTIIIIIMLFLLLLLMLFVAYFVVVFDQVHMGKRFILQYSYGCPCLRG